MTTGRHASRRSRTAVLVALAVSLSVGAQVSAHRRDEYLQAARLGIESGRVELELDLTPGIAVAESILEDIDRDGDGSLSPEEERAYASRVLDAVHLAVDDQLLRLQSGTYLFPDVNAVRSGEGVIRLRAEASLPPLASGEHQLFFRNVHRDDVGVYLANVLLPESQRIGVLAQRRDATQRELTIEYVMRSRFATLTGLLLPGSLAGLAAAALLLRRSTGTRRLAAFTRNRTSHVN